MNRGEEEGCRPRHIPVMIREVVEAFRPFPGGLFIDATLGPGGHSEAVLGSIHEIEAFAGIDRDSEALVLAKKRLGPGAVPMEFHHGNFRDLASLSDGGWNGTVGGILFDLGTSSLHLDNGERGFSHRLEGPLDMRMNRDQERSAFHIVNEYTAGELKDLFRRWGEERNAGAIARAVVRERESSPIDDTARLASAVGSRLAPRWRTKGLSRIFQAIRMEVNDEIASLETGIETAVDMLAPRGRIAVISYHSLEDRLVKRRFRDFATGCVCPPRMPVCACGHKAVLELTPRRALRPSDEEIAANPRSRSARLRIATKIDEEANGKGGGS